MQVNVEHPTGIHLKTGDPPHFSASMLSVAGNSESRLHTVKAKRTEKKVFLTRILFWRCLMVITLLGTTAACGYFAFDILTESEKKVYESEYSSISSQALDAAVSNLKRMSQGAELMATTLSEEYPYADMWPNVAYRGFHKVSKQLTELSKLESVAFGPILQPSQAADWEDFAYDHYEADPDSPAGTGISSFGEGISGFSPFSPAPDQKYHDQTGIAFAYDSPYQLMIPVFQISVSDAVRSELTMFNLRLDPTLGPTLDEVITCANSTPEESCQTISDLISNPFLFLDDPNPTIVDSLSLIFYPVFPRNNSSTLVGITGGFAMWSSVLEEIVPDDVNGIDFIISTQTATYTYRVKHGKVKFVGKGDKHDDDFDRYKKSKDLSVSSLDYSGNVKYTFTVYPREEFFDEYTTDTPIRGCIATVLVILLASAIFVFYDLAVKAESNHKQRVLDTKRKFVRFISHEIRTPLNTVRLGLSLLETELGSLVSSLAGVPVDQVIPKITEAVVEWAELTNDILHNSESAVSVLDDLLNYDKVEMGTLRLEWGAVFIWDVIKKVFKGFALTSKQKDINLVMSLERWDPAVQRQRKAELDLLRVVGDDTRLAQVLRNYISNAVKFTPQGGTVTVTAELVRNGLQIAQIVLPEEKTDLMDPPRAGSVRISVKDTGAGLSEQQLSEIFAEGVQFNANLLQAGGGSGLGLYISKGIVEQHGGIVGVSSEGLGKGTTFWCELPLFKYPPGLMPRQASTLSQASSDSSRKVAIAPKRIFLVDDAVSNRKLLNRLLTKKGHDCVEACDGLEAVDTYIEADSRGEYFDAILMDFEMPRMNGPEATRRIRELGCFSLIVGVTGNMLPEDVQFFRDNGADAVLPKPLNLQKFEEMLRTFKEDIYLYPDIEKGGTGAAKEGKSGKEERGAAADGTVHADATVQLVPFKSPGCGIDSNNNVVVSSQTSNALSNTSTVGAATAATTTAAPTVSAGNSSRVGGETVHDNVLGFSAPSTGDKHSLPPVIAPASSKKYCFRVDAIAPREGKGGDTDDEELDSSAMGNQNQVSGSGSSCRGILGSFKLEDVSTKKVHPDPPY